MTYSRIPAKNTPLFFKSINYENKRRNIRAYKRYTK